MLNSFISFAISVAVVITTSTTAAQAITLYFVILIALRVDDIYLLLKSPAQDVKSCVSREISSNSYRNRPDNRG